MRWYVEALKKFATVSGRARRVEFWMFHLINFMITIVLMIVESATRAVPPGKAGALANVYSLAALIPSVAVGARRMHDTGHSGWWYICPLVNLVLAVQDGQRRSNRYGPEPMSDGS